MQPAEAAATPSEVQPPQGELDCAAAGETIGLAAVPVSLYKETAEVRLGVSFYSGEEAAELGLAPTDAVIKAVVEGSAAAEALLPGDRVLSVGGRPVEKAIHAVQILRESAGYVRIVKVAADRDFASRALAQTMAAHRRADAVLATGSPSPPRILGRGSSAAGSRNAISLQSSGGVRRQTASVIASRDSSSAVPGLDLAAVHRPAKSAAADGHGQGKAPLSARIMNSARSARHSVEKYIYDAFDEQL